MEQESYYDFRRKFYSVVSYLNLLWEPKFHTDCTNCILKVQIMTYKLFYLTEFGGSAFQYVNLGGLETTST